jgi:DNA-binding NarL/FixJ family response regulator
MIKIVICRNDAYGEALSLLLGNSSYFNVLGTFDCVSSALKKIHITPDIFLIDFSESIARTYQNIQNIRSASPDSKIIILTDQNDREKIIGCLHAGVDGYLLTKTSLMMLRDFIIEAMNGGFPMSPHVSQTVIETFRKGQTEVSSHELLTNRERDVLQLLVKGMSYKLISADLAIAIDTVRSHIKSIYEKLSVNSKSEAVAKALRYGMIHSW